jgi:hypothetical protein
MADVIEDEASLIESEAALPRDPFDGDCQELQWLAEVNVGQLQQEASARQGSEVRVVVSAPKYDRHGTARPTGDPVTVFVHPAAVDLEAVREVLAAHRPDPYAGLSEEEVREVLLMEKARSDEPMTLAEMREVIRILAAG